MHLFLEQGAVISRRGCSLYICAFDTASAVVLMSLFVHACHIHILSEFFPEFIMKFITRKCCVSMVNNSVIFRGRKSLFILLKQKYLNYIMTLQYSANSELCCELVAPPKKF